MVLAAVTLSLSFSARSANAQFTFFETTGADPASITPTVDAFRAALGTLNPNTPVTFPDGRREINWDAVPDAFSDPNAFPGDFFNQNFAGRARGALFSTPGSGFLVSADSDNPTGTAPLFGFPNDFQVFSAQRLFTPVNSTITDVTFFLPGTTTAAEVRGFGVVFTDLEVAGSTRLDFFDAFGNLLVSRDGLVGGNQSLTFLGVATTGNRFARVRITNGSASLVVNGQYGDGDAVPMDDFIYAEPTAIAAAPEPGTIGLLALGVLAGFGVRRRR